MIENNEYRRVIMKEYLRLSKIAFRTEQKTLEALRGHVAVAPDQYEGIFAERHTNRETFQRSKAVIDYIAMKQPELLEEERIYFSLLEDQYKKDIVRQSFKAPYDFILKVPITQWKRYKTSYLPKRRMIPQYFQDFLKTKKRFKLIRVPSGKVTKVQRPRGYNDHGSRASDDSIFRKKANQDYQRLLQHIKLTTERHSLNLRKYSDPKRARIETLRELRKIYKLPVNTTLDNVEKRYLSIKSRCRNGQ